MRHPRVALTPARLIAAAAALALVLGACGPRSAGTVGAVGAVGADPVSRTAAIPDVLSVATATGTLRIDAAAGRTLVTLPDGAATPDWRRYWTVATANVSPGTARTTLRELDPATGAELRSLTIDGRWAMPASYGAAPSGFSTDGHWLVLAAPQTIVGTATTSAFAVIDTVQGTLARTVVATGDHTFDAISADGRSLYVVEHLGAPNEYRVRVAGGGGAALSVTPIVNIKVAAPQMNGIYLLLRRPAERHLELRPVLQPDAWCVRSRAEHLAALRTMHPRCPRRRTRGPAGLVDAAQSDRWAPGT